MDYYVKQHDTLPKIAREQLGNQERWHELAALNNIRPPYRFYIGQRLHLPPLHPPSTRFRAVQTHNSGEHSQHQPAQYIPSRAFTFIVADEINPLRRKLVRRAIVHQNPELHGFNPKDPTTNHTPGRHAQGMNDSKFISASEHPFGSKRFEGKPYWIDAKKVVNNGGRIIEGKEIARDLDRIIAKTKKPETIAKLLEIKKKVMVIDREVLIEGGVPAAAVKGGASMALTRGLQVVEGVGLVLSVYDLSEASVKSYQQKSVRPIAAESVRQIGGWGGALAGAEFGGMAGAALGIETGPGAIITGAVGALFFGAVGFFDADYVAKHIYKGD